MKKSAERILGQELNTIITSLDYKVVKQSFDKLINLSDVLDSIGDVKDADRVDEIVKGAAGIWDFLLSGAGGAATTKNDSGKSIIDAIRGGHVGDFFSKETLVRIITNFLVTGGIGLLATELVDVLTDKVPVFKWFGDSKLMKFIISGALTYAVKNSDFVTKLVDGIVQQIDEAFNIKRTPAQPHSPVPPTTPTPVKPITAPIAKAPEGSDAGTFQVAPGAKV